MNNPGEYLKTIRLEKNLGVKRVYKETGVGDSTIRRIETGEIESPAAKHLKALASYYNIDVIELYCSYGYLSNLDVETYKRCFRNTDQLTKTEIDTIQNLIDLLIEKKVQII